MWNLTGAKPTNTYSIRRACLVFSRVMALVFLRSATSPKRNFATSAISFLGTGAESGKRIVPFSTSYVAS